MFFYPSVWFYVSPYTSCTQWGLVLLSSKFCYFLNNFLNIYSEIVCYNFCGHVFFNFTYLFIFYLWLCWVFNAMWALLCGREQGYSWLLWQDLTLQGILLLWSTDSRVHGASIVATHGLSSFGSQDSYLWATRKPLCYFK